MKKKIAELLKGFKPQFGNENHIKALELISRIKKVEALKRKRKEFLEESAWEIAELKREVSQEEKNLEWLITH